MNALIANKLAMMMSSMWLFWVLSIFILIAGLIEPPKDPYTFVMFVISAGFQAIALPVLAFVSNIQSDKQMKLIQDNHNMLMKMVNESHDKLMAEIQKQQSD